MAYQKIKLSQFLAQHTDTPRRKLLPMIQSGSITINGKQTSNLSALISIQKDIIAIDGRAITPRLQFAYYKFHKPKGIITTMNDPKGRPCIKDYLKDLPKGLVPIGRLDRNTSGLLLLSNDGKWANKITHPSYEIEKTYQVTLDKPLTRSDAHLLTTGLKLEDGPAVFNSLEKLDQKKYEVTLHIGKNRIIRRTFSHLGYDVIKLHRTTIGTIHLKPLKRGQITALTKTELNSLKNS